MEHKDGNRSKLLSSVASSPDAEYGLQVQDVRKYPLVTDVKVFSKPVQPLANRQQAQDDKSATTRSSEVPSVRLRSKRKDNVAQGLRMDVESKSLPSKYETSNFVPRVSQPVAGKVFDTYGETALEHFRKRELEKHYQIFEKPRLFSQGMRIVVIVMELVILAVFAVFIHWLVEVRNASFEISDVVGGSKENEGEEGQKTKKTISQTKLDIHMTIYVLVFVILLPHVMVLAVVFEFCTPARLTFLTSLLKALSFFLFFSGLFDIQTEAKKLGRTAERARDFATHACFSQGAIIVFILYVIVTSVRVAGHVFKQTFQIRIVGGLLKILVSEWLVDSVDYLTYLAGYISLLTGFSAYLFYFQPAASSRLVGESSKQITEDERDHVLTICILLAVLYVTLLWANFQKHFINNHTHFITLEEFEKVFLRFRPLYEEENVMDMGQAMPKVTSAERMA